MKAYNKKGKSTNFTTERWKATKGALRISLLVPDRYCLTWKYNSCKKKGKMLHCRITTLAGIKENYEITCKAGI